MTQIYIGCGLGALASGLIFGRLQMFWLLNQIVTAGAAALAVFVLQSLLGFGLDTVPRVGAVRIEAVVFVEIVVLATLGWYLSRGGNE